MGRKEMRLKEKKGRGLLNRSLVRKKGKQRKR